MAKQIAPQITRHFDERRARDPSRSAPQKIVRGYKRNQEKKGQPHLFRCSGRQTVDQEFHPVLSSNRAQNRKGDGRHNHCMRQPMLPQITADECDRPTPIADKIIHAFATSLF
jgi:hypothetical protein